MKSYLDILRRVLNEGTAKQPVRVAQGVGVETVGNTTIGLPNIFWTHSMDEGFPLITTKKAAVKSTLVELEGFIKGITSKRWYEERGCKFWSAWANPETAREQFEYDKKMVGGPEPLEWTEENRKISQERCDDLGPLGYAWGWRRFGENYPSKTRNGLEKGVDQLAIIADRLRTNPTDRRMLVSAWNPLQLHLCALPSCHSLFGVTVYDGAVNLSWFQRSADLPAGFWANILSYATLLTLFSRHSNLRPGKLSCLILDGHIYEDQIPFVEEQLNREPYPLPSVEIPSNSDEDGYEFNIFNWDHTQFELSGYQHHPALKMPVTV